MAKAFTQLISELRAQSWTVERTTKSHWKCTPPEKGRPLVHFSESEDTHAFKNTVADLKRSGFVWPPPSRREEREGREADVPAVHEHVWGHTHYSSNSRRAESCRDCPATRQVGDDGSWVVQEAPEVTSAESSGSASPETVADPEAEPDWLPKYVVVAPEKSEEQVMDELWSTLKEARSYLSLATEHRVTCASRVAAARKDLEGADADRLKAIEDLKRAKVAFDDHFAAARDESDEAAE